MGQKRKKLTTSMLLLAIMPLLCFGVIILCITSHIIYDGLKDEIQYSLTMLADSSYQAYDILYPGDYTGENNAVKKGDVSVEQTQSFIDERKKLTGVDYTLFYGNVRSITTVESLDGTRAMGTTADNQVTKTVLVEHNTFFSDKVSVDGQLYFGYYEPIKNADDTVVGMIFAGKPRSIVMKSINRNIFMVCGLGMIILSITLAAIMHFSRRLIYALHKTESYLGQVAQGDLNAKLDSYVLERRDEIGEMGRFAVMLQKSIVELVGKDPLTELGNRRSCDTVLRNLTNGEAKKEQLFTVVMADIDFFKRVNDKHGHQAGDEVLKTIARIFGEHMEHLGFVFRWGGEEFLLVYEAMDEDRTRAHLVELQEQIRKSYVFWEGERIHITLTFGMADNSREKVPEHLVQMADENLYRGKNSGRDIIIGTKD